MTNEDRAEAIQRGENRAENMERLYYDNMGLWVYALRPFASLGDMEDLKQQAFLSVMKAAQKYDRKRGAFSTYAVRCIIQDIPVYLTSCGNGLSYPAFFGHRIGQYKNLLKKGIEDEREIAEKMGLSVAEVRLVGMVSGEVASLDYNNGAGELVEVVASGEDVAEEVADSIAREQLAREVWEEVENTLSGRRLEIIKSIFLDNETARAISKRLGVSYQRVSQIEKAALARLKKSEKLERLAEQYDYITCYMWRTSLESWKHTGDSSVERYVMEKERLDTRRNKLIENLLKTGREWREEQRKAEVWRRIVEEVGKRRA